MTTVFATINVPITVEDNLIEDLRKFENSNRTMWNEACNALDKVIKQSILEEPNRIIGENATILEVSETDENGDFDLLYAL